MMVLKHSNEFEPWCVECNAKRFKQNFPNWTSRIVCIDKFIRESQLNAQNKNQVLEWIPYDRLVNIEYNEAIWLDGPIKEWSDVEKAWIRNGETRVGLKKLDKFSKVVWYYYLFIFSLSWNGLFQTNFYLFI